MGLQSAAVAVPRDEAFPEPTLGRIAGADRYATSAAISARQPVRPDTIFLATGENFPDALVGGAAAAFHRGSLLLTASNFLPEPVRNELKRIRPRTIVVLGSPSSVSDEVLAQARSYANQVYRVSGSSRYETAVNLSRKAFAQGAGNVIIATGRNYPDALSASSLFWFHPGPILLSDGPNGLDEQTLAEVRRLDPGMIFLLGSEATVPSRVEEQLGALEAHIVRLAGADRYLTSLEVAKYTFEGNSAEPLPVRSVYLPTGANYPDGLSVGPLASTTPSPVLLNNGSCLPRETAEFIKALRPNQLVALGKPQTVSDDVLRLKTC